MFFARHTCLTLSEINNWPYVDFELFMRELKEELEEEARKAKAEQQRANKKPSFNSIASQLRSMMPKFGK